MPNYVEVSYEDKQGLLILDHKLEDLAGKYEGIVSERLSDGDKRILEFLFPHLVNASWFTTDIRSYMPQVALDKLS